MEDKRIQWLCQNVPSFEPAYLQAEKAKAETEANRRKMAPHMKPRDQLAYEREMENTL